MDELQRQLTETQSELEQAQTQIRKLEAQLDRRTMQRLAGLHAIDRAILASQTLEELAATALAHIVQIVPNQRATILSVNLDDQTVYALALHTKHTTSVPPYRSYPIPASELSAIAEQRYLSYTDLAGHVSPIMRQLYQEGLRTTLTVGLKADNKLIGIVNLHSNQFKSFDESEIEVALEVADQIAIGMHTINLRETVQKYVSELEDWVAQRTESLANEKANVEAILNSSANAILLVDVEQGIQRVNTTFNGMFGIPNADAVGKPLSALVRLEDQPLLHDALHAMRTHGRIQRLEVQVVAADGSPTDVEIGLAPIKQNGNAPTQFVCTMNDITERKRAEQALRESEQRFRLLVKEVQDYAIYTIDLQGRVTSWNAGAERIKGYQEHEIVGNPFDQFYTPEARQADEPQHVLKVAAERGAYVGEGWRVRKDGSRFWAAVVVTALHDENGNLVGFSKITRDLTEHKQSEDAMRQALARERELSELKSRFISIASHEFRTPLAIIQSTTDTLFYFSRLTPQQVEHKLNAIHRQIDRLTEILENILELGRIQAGNIKLRLTHVDVNALCNEIAEAFQASNHGRIMYTSDVDTLFADVDAHFINLIVSNLTSNALKYSGEQPVHLMLTATATAFVIQVRDQGMGIPPNDLPHLFAPFYRASNVSSIAGTGVGLSIVKQAVELHGGSIIVTSELGRGTTFTTTIPLKPSTP